MWDEEAPPTLASATNHRVGMSWQIVLTNLTLHCVEIAVAKAA